MSLTQEDLTDIRGIVIDSIVEALGTMVNPRFDRLEDHMDGLENRMNSLEGRVGNLETGQQETNRRLSAIETKLVDIEGRLEALEADVRELYLLVRELQDGGIIDKKFAKRSVEQKLLTLHAETQALAKKVGIKLPV